MLDRSHAEAVIFRVAVASFTYYPSKTADEPGYALEEDVAWCMAPLVSLHAQGQAAYHERVTTLITDPLENRRAFVLDVMALAEG